MLVRDKMVEAPLMILSGCPSAREGHRLASRTAHHPLISSGPRSVVWGMALLCALGQQVVPSRQGLSQEV